ncbi:MAG: hypothetical protein HFJ04_05250 [Lachnospiraceae bacterium]|nr:hypothetical protein [Lachnospiraceae bacterium]
MKKKMRNTAKKCLSLLLAVVMLLAVQGIPVLAETVSNDTIESAGRDMPKNPVHHCTKKDDGTDTTDWSYVYFGSYPQTEVTGDALTEAITGASYDGSGDAWVNGTKYCRISKSDTNNTSYFGSGDYRYFKWERIKWRVLENNGGTLFVVADKGLDCKDYNEAYTSITWENCTLRSWLNSEFYGTAFSSSEQGAIVRQNVVNEDNPYYGTEGGNDTSDNVFLLSIGEVLNPEYGFCEDYGNSASRWMQASDYAHARGAYIYSSSSIGGNANCWWWLRSPGSNAYIAADVSSNGYVDRYGLVFNDDGACVPALHINLSSDLWSTADDGSSGGGGNGGTKDDWISSFRIDSSASGTIDAPVTLSGSLELSDQAETSSSILQQEIDAITWTSSDFAIAKVSNVSASKSPDNRSASLTVTVTPYQVGTVTITGKTSTGLTASCEVTVTSESSIECAAFSSMEEGDTDYVVVYAYGDDFASLKSISESIVWKSQDTSVATVKGGGIIYPMAPNTIQAESGLYEIWRGMGMLEITGVAEGATKIIGTASDGSTAVCSVTVTAKSEDASEDGDGSAGMGLTLGTNAQASNGDAFSGFFPGTWSMKQMVFPVQISRKQKDDGSFTMKVSIGLGKSDVLNSDASWDQYKKNVDNLKDYLDYGYNNMEKLTKDFDLKSFKSVEVDNIKAVPKVSAMGYMECTFDKNGKAISRAFNLAIDAKWSGGAGWQFVTPIGPMYLNLEGSAKMSGDLGVKRELEADKAQSDEEFLKDVLNGKNLSGSLSLTPALSLEGGYGVNKVATIGANGEVSAPFTFLPEQKWEFEAKASLHVQIVFVLDFKRELASTGKLLAWPRQKSVDSVGIDLSDGTLSAMDTSFAAYETEWNGSVPHSSESVDAVGADPSFTETILMDGILPSSLPMQAEIGGKNVLVFQSYDSTRKTLDSSALMYSVCENGIWSNPQPVWDNGYCDMYADMKVVNGKLALTWQKTKAKAEGNIETDSEGVLEDIARNSEICFAEFDEISGTFINQTYVTDNEACDMMPKFCAGSDNVTVAWVRNDALDFMQETGANTIYTASWNGTSFETETVLAHSFGTVEDFTAYYDGEDVKTIYAAKIGEGDEKVQALLDETGRAVESLSELVGSTSISNMQYTDGKVTAFSDGTLYVYRLADGTASSYSAGESAFGSTAIYCTNGEKGGYVWSLYNEETDTGSIVASMESEDGYSEPLTLYEKKGVMWRYISPILKEDGSWEFLANAMQTEDGQENHNSLIYIKKQMGSGIELVDASINEFDTKDGFTGLDYFVRNIGDAAIDQLKLKITFKDGTVSTKDIPVTILPGEDLVDTVYVDLSDIDTAQDILVSITAKDQADTEGCIVTTIVGQADVETAGTAEESGDMLKITAKLTNHSKIDADTKLYLYSDENCTKELYSSQTGIIAANSSEQFQIQVKKNDIVYNKNDAAYLTLKAVVDGGDYNEDNNVSYIILYKPDTGTGENKPGSGEEKPGTDQPGSGQTPGTGTGTGQKPNTGTGSGTGTGTVPAVSKISIQSPSKKIAAGKKVSLSIAVSPKGAAKPKVTWTSSNKKYAAVNSKGVVTTKKAGKGKTVAITAAASDGRKAIIKLKIMKHAVTKVQIKNTYRQLKAGKTLTLKATVKANGRNANKTLKWTTSNKAWATVTAKGKVTAKKAGKGKTVTITAASTDGTNKKARVKIKIK